MTLARESGDAGNRNATISLRRSKEQADRLTDAVDDLLLAARVDVEHLPERRASALDTIDAVIDTRARAFRVLRASALDAQNRRRDGFGRPGSVARTVFAHLHRERAKFSRDGDAGHGRSDETTANAIVSRERSRHRHRRRASAVHFRSLLSRRARPDGSRRAAAASACHRRCARSRAPRRHRRRATAARAR